ncbi:hypothetical protein MRX96_020351 [Rhipicephalus microplus]
MAGSPSYQGLPGGAFPKALQKKTAPLDWHQSIPGSRAGTLANAALFLLQAKLRKLSSTVCKLTWSSPAVHHCGCASQRLTSPLRRMAGSPSYQG